MLPSGGYEWRGFRRLGHGFRLPEAYLAAAFSEATLAECRRLAPAKVDCSRVGASAAAGVSRLHASSSADDSAPLRSLPFPNRFQSGGLELCVAYATAGGVDLLGDAANADWIGELGAPSLDLPPGESRVEFVRTKCMETLQPTYTMKRLRSPLQLSLAQVLAPPAADVVVVYRIIDSHEFPDHCLATVADAQGAGWICDMNHASYLPLTAANLDACCISEGSCFAGVKEGYTLARQPPPPAKQKTKRKRR